MRPVWKDFQEKMREPVPDETLGRAFQEGGGEWDRPTDQTPDLLDGVVTGRDGGLGRRLSPSH